MTDRDQRVIPLAMPPYALKEITNYYIYLTFFTEITPLEQDIAAMETTLQLRCCRVASVAAPLVCH